MTEVWKLGSLAAGMGYVRPELQQVMKKKGANDLPKASVKQFCQNSSILSEVSPRLVYDWNDAEKDLLFSSSRVSLILEESQYKLYPLVCSHVNLL